ncbi:MAG: helix-turn-helix transcriptional regulator, partial [Synergistaceae bacterium]|nr:helix-turn-helix transcriptional regulator [Synergistaceae bacterium]
MGNKFAEMLRLLLKQHHVQQSELAQNIGVKRTTISMYATGNSRPDIDGLIKIAQFFNVSLDYLMTGERFENRITREELGLSERALEILKQT